MNIPYRTRRKIKRAGTILAVCAMIFILVWFCSVIFLERYVVYTREGAHLDFSRSADEIQGEVARPPQGQLNVSIFYNEGDNAMNSNAVLRKLEGYYIDADAMMHHMTEVWDALKIIPKETPIMIEMKGPNGYFYYPSTLADAVKANNLSVDAVGELVKELHKKGYYTIAKVSTFRDYNYGLNHVSQGMALKGTPYLWPDAGNCYWLQPDNDNVLSWVATYVKEIREMGFNEVLLSDFQYPATDKVNVPEDKNAILEASAKKLLEACGDETFTVSFGVSDSSFQLPEGRCRAYLENIDARNVASQLANTKITDPSVRLVFVAKTNDTRYAQGSVLRPISAAEVLEAQKADREASKALAEKNKPGVKEKKKKDETAAAEATQPAAETSAP